jgi:glutathione S-transferase
VDAPLRQNQSLLRLGHGRADQRSKAEFGERKRYIAMKLFYMPGASSLFPHIVLYEADLPFEKVKVDEHTKLTDHAVDYRTINPLGFVPSLQLNDGTILTESAAIVQYIADQVPAKQLAPPNGTLERTKLQSWLNFIVSEIQVGCFCPLFHEVTSDAAKTMYRDRLASRLAHIDRHLAQNEYMLGENFSLADVYLFVVLNWSRAAEFDLSSYARILELRKKVGARAAVRAAMQAEGLIM